MKVAEKRENSIGKIFHPFDYTVKALTYPRMFLYQMKFFNPTEIC